MAKRSVESDATITRIMPILISGMLMLILMLSIGDALGGEMEYKGK